MAGARLEKVGTIFARMNAMLRKNVLSPEDKPIWYEIYALHPPYNEPRYDQEPPKNEIKEILYEEDLVRAKFHDRIRRYETTNLSDYSYESRTRKFINLYRNLKNQGALDDEKVFEVALEQLNASGKQRTEVLEDEIDENVNFGLTSSFAKAIEESKPIDVKKDEAPKNTKHTGSIDVKSLF